jgi:hypothetical protein
VAILKRNKKSFSIPNITSLLIKTLLNEGPLLDKKLELEELALKNRYLLKYMYKS